MYRSERPNLVDYRDEPHRGSWSHDSADSPAARPGSDNRVPAANTLPPAMSMSREPSRNGHAFSGNGLALPTSTTTTPLPSPVRFAPTGSDSHQAYTLGTPTLTPSTRNSTSSLLPRASSTSSFASMSAGMERSQSAASDHSRHESLTSACAPVTTSILGSSSRSEVEAFADGRASLRRSHDWSGDGEKSHRGDEDVREGAKRRSAEQAGFLDRALDAPGAVLGYLTRPLRTAPATRALSTPSTLSGSPYSNKTPAKRSPLLIRLAIVAYLAFSFLYLTCSLPRYLFGTSTSSGGTAALVSDKVESWQIVREYADELGAKAGIELPWAKNVAGPTRAASAETVSVAPEAEAEPADSGWGKVRRIGNPDDPSSASRDAKANPLTPFTHTYRFSKMHDKVHWDLHDEIIPYAFHATAKVDRDDATALMYSNDAWLETLPTFVQAWRGPVSLVFETAHSRHDSARRAALLNAIATLREAHPLVKQFVDFHLLGVPTSMSSRSIAKTRERMIRQPFARNFHLNLARFFAQTDVIFLAGDARLTPSGGLRRKLTEPKAREIMLERGDALVIPVFGFLRDDNGQSASVATTSQLREQLGFPEDEDAFAGVRDDEFEAIAAQYVHQLFESLPVAPEDWPTRKQSLVQLANAPASGALDSTVARLALFDRRWEPNRGPSNWYLWRKPAADPRLNEEPAAGGGLGLGLGGKVGGGHEPYRVVDYDLHYAPLVAMSRKGHPWCTERFDDLRAACTYQMFLAGAEMYVLPEDWAFTLEVVEKSQKKSLEDPAEKLKTSISSRLYGKFHQEACMHYGREFLSVGMWDSDKAQHLRETCARTLGTWGMGSA